MFPNQGHLNDYEIYENDHVYLHGFGQPIIVQLCVVLKKIVTWSLPWYLNIKQTHDHHQQQQQSLS